MAYWTIYAILLMVSVAPVWMVTAPPLADYPNHLARMHILASGAQSEFLGRFYAVSWSVIPNLAMDIIVPALVNFMPLEIAGKVFVTLILALLASGSLVLHYTIHKRFSPWPLLVFLFLYNGVFLFGMVNYLFGIGLCLWAIAAWIETRKYGHSARVVLFYTTCVILFFAHLSAMGVYVLSVIAYEASQISRLRPLPGNLIRWLVLLIAGPLFLLAMLILLPRSTTNETLPFTYGPVAFALSQKLGALELIVRNYVRVLDIATLGAVIWLVLFGLLTQRLHVDRVMRWPALAIAIAGFCLPYQVMGSNFADARILVAAAFLFVCTTDLRAKPAHLALFGLVIVALFSGRMLILGSHWQGAEALHKQVSAAVVEIPRGARLLAVSVGNPDEPYEAPGPHIAATAVIHREVFLPSVYAMPRGQPLTFTEQYQALARNAPKPDQWSGDAFTWKQVEQDYDFILLTGIDRLKVAPPDSLVTVVQETGFRLYRTRRSFESGH
ncbi:MAG TPA: hypothetical protein VFO74_12455 [Pseudolabrys sp.]|nr:hypothetical protein [Pseudolabrys sp.]